MNLYTSDLLTPEDNFLEVLIDQVDIFANMVELTVSKYSANDEFVKKIVPKVTYVENSVETKTRIRVYLAEGQLAAGEKLKLSLDSN